MTPLIYLDNASTTKIDPEVLDAMMPFLTDEYGNAGTLYELGLRANAAVENARLQVASFIGSKPENIIFTSGGSESNSMVFASIPLIFQQKVRQKLAISAVEHASVINSAQNMAIKSGFHLTRIPVSKNGDVEIKTIENMFNDAGLGFVSVMGMNNETGVSNPIESIGALCKENDVIFHTDCVQAAGCVDLDVEKIGCDFLTISSHKIHGPKGVGALYVRDQTMLSPIIFGGSYQESGFRGGTENVAGIVGFGKACAIAEKRQGKSSSIVAALKEMFYYNLLANLKIHHLDNVFHINGLWDYKHGKTLNIRFDNVDGETLLMLLGANGVCVSAGSACQAHESKPSHVLLAMGLSPEEAMNSIRVSFSRMNTHTEIVYAARIIAECVAKLHP